MTRPDRLRYPAICFGRDSSISIVTSSEELSRCNALAWFQNRYFDDLRVTDATATPFRVWSAELAPPLRGWRRLLARAVNKSLVVSIECERVGESSSGDTKETTIEWLRRAHVPEPSVNSPRERLQER